MKHTNVGAILLAAAAGLFISAGPAQGFTSFYTDRTSFAAGLGATVLDDYSHPDYAVTQNNLAMNSVLGETDYQPTGWDQNNIIDGGGYSAGPNGSFILSFGTTSVGSSNGVFGVGFDYFNQFNLHFISAGVIYSAYITFGNGTTQNIALEQTVQDKIQGGAFFGVQSDLLISSIAFGLYNGAPSRNGRFGIDNLTIGAQRATADVPAPLGALGGLAAWACGRTLKQRRRHMRQIGLAMASASGRSHQPQPCRR